MGFGPARASPPHPPCPPSMPPAVRRKHNWGRSWGSREATGATDSIRIGAGGATGFHDMRVRSNSTNFFGVPLGPASGPYDLSNSLSVGFGYGLSCNLYLSLVQAFGMGWHTKTDLSDGVARTWRVRTTRAALRFGFGSHRSRLRPPLCPVIRTAAWSASSPPYARHRSRQPCSVPA